MNHTLRKLGIKEWDILPVDNDVSGVILLEMDYRYDTDGMPIDPERFYDVSYHAITEKPLVFCQERHSMLS